MKVATNEAVSRKVGIIENTVKTTPYGLLNNSTWITPGLVSLQNLWPGVPRRYEILNWGKEAHRTPLIATSLIEAMIILRQQFEVLFASLPNMDIQTLGDAQDSP